MRKYILKKKMFKPLHLLNNLRFDYIFKKIIFKNKSILDLGCGIGMLSEKLSLHGGMVTGIDKSSSLIEIALENARKKKLSIKYICSNFLSVENFNFKFDIIICTEVIEHLDDIFNFFIFLDKVSKKNTIIFISSLNKNFMSYFKIILLGEFISGTLVKNTHNIDSFFDVFILKDHLKKIGFYINDIKYLNYDGILKYPFLDFNSNINYLVEVIKKT